MTTGLLAFFMDFLCAGKFQRKKEAMQAARKVCDSSLREGSQTANAGGGHQDRPRSGGTRSSFCGNRILRIASCPLYIKSRARTHENQVSLLATTR
jgi:hypothetical protein